MGLPCILPSVKNRISKAPGLSPDGRSTSWEPGFQSAAPPPAHENREICTHPHRAWEPVGWGVPVHLLSPPPPSKNSTEAASFLLLRKKHFVLSFLSFARLGISVSSDCTVLGPWHTCAESSCRTGSGPTQRSCLSPTLAQCPPTPGLNQEVPP